MQANIVCISYIYNVSHTILIQAVNGCAQESFSASIKSAVFDCSGTRKDAEETKVMGKGTLLNVQRLIENQISMLMIYHNIKELNV